MQCRAEAGSGTSLTYATIINDRVQRRGKKPTGTCPRGMSMPTASQNCLATSPQAGPFLSLLVAPRSKAPRLSTFSPNPQKNFGEVDGWWAIFSIKILTLLEPSGKN